MSEGPVSLPAGAVRADLSEAQRAVIEALATDDRPIRAPLWLAKQAQIPNDALERAQAAADERQRLMRELHDGLGAKLVNAQQRVESAALDRAGVARSLRACVDDMRLAIEALGPEGADLTALLGSFRFRWEALLRDARVQLRWQVGLPESAPAVAPYAALAILRVMQEAFDNVLRHADAHAVTLEMTGQGSTLVLAIEDDGRGFDHDAPAAGRGIADMRGRANALGARLALVTPPGGGTRVELQLELPD